MHYKFILVESASGTDQSVWVLPPPVTVGRSPEAEVSIGHPSLSRRHCQFTVNAFGALVVRDLDSLNGTYIDDSRITKSVLQPGTRVRMGAITLRVEWTTEDETSIPKIGSAGDVKTTQPMKIWPPKR